MLNYKNIIPACKFKSFDEIIFFFSENIGLKTWREISIFRSIVFLQIICEKKWYQIYPYLSKRNLLNILSITLIAEKNKRGRKKNG